LNITQSNKYIDIFGQKTQNNDRIDPTKTEKCQWSEITQQDLRQ
jgi:hypothetical protein